MDRYELEEALATLIKAAWYVDQDAAMSVITDLINCSRDRHLQEQLEWLAAVLSNRVSASRNTC